MNFYRRSLAAALAVALIYVGWKFHAPFFFRVRNLLPAFSLIAAGPLFILQWKYFSAAKGRRRLLEGCLGALCLAAAVLPAAQERIAVHMKTKLLRSDPALLQELGRHFIVGYTDLKDLKALVARGAIGGIFITQKNIRGKSREQVRQEIEELQKIQAGLGLPPLWVAADQEGGLVSRLSPLVEASPALGSLVLEGNESIPLSEPFLRRMKYFAERQARDLRTLGVNLNLSPVVDLRPERRLSLLNDRHTRLDLRAISEDPEMVTEVALEYCRILAASGVLPTLKHFPGLASVAVDTHFSLGQAKRSLQELQSKDWRPFRRILASTPAFLMLGHVRVPELDEEYPASTSRKIVQKVLRREWGFNGVLVTDDFSMGAIYEGQNGVEGASLRALNAGVDLLLLSYDPDLYYPAMLALLKAKERGEIAEGFLEQSKARLAAAQKFSKGPNDEKMDVSFRPSPLAPGDRRPKPSSRRKPVLRDATERVLEAGMATPDLRS